MLLKVPLERDQLQTVRIEQRHVRDTRLIVGIDEDLEVRLEVEAVLMEEPGIQRIIAGHPLDQGSIEGNLLLRL